jgi:hypothetical protein
MKNERSCCNVEEKMKEQQQKQLRRRIPSTTQLFKQNTTHGKRRRTWENAEIQTSDNEDGMQVREKLEWEKKKKIAQEHEEEEHEHASSSSSASADGKKCERFRGRFVEPCGVGFTARTGIGRGNERTNERATRGAKFRCPKFEDLEQYVNLPVEGPLRVTILVFGQ